VEPTSQVSVGHAFSWAIATFRHNAVPFLALAGVVTLIQFAQQWAVDPVATVLTECFDVESPIDPEICVQTFGSTLRNGIVLGLVFFVLTFLATIGVYRAALRSTRGQSPSFADMLTGENLGAYIRVTLAQLALVLLGLLACIVPGLIAAFFVQLAHYYALDKGYGVQQSLRASFQAIGQHLLPALVMAAVAFGVLLAGTFFFGVLTLLTLPFLALFTANLFRQFNQEPIVGSSLQSGP
jgi:uncharacterized membrane protein